MKRVVTAITTTTIALSGASALTVSADAHEVVKRDTLWGISQKHGTSVEELMGWNKLSSTLIYPGQKISTTNDKIDKPKATVKSKDKSTKSKSDSATYTVVAGDTLSEIAFEYGVTYEELMEWNDLTTTLIYPGQELKVKKDDKKTKEAPTREKVQPKESEEKVESKDKIDKSTQDKAVELEKKEAKQKDEKQDTASKSETKPASDSKSESNQEKPDKKITASSGDTYTVNAGDTLSEIAFAHDVSFDDLMKWNNLSSTIVVPGDTLTVNDSEKQVSDNSSDEQKDNEIKEEPKQKEPKQKEPKQEEPKQEEPKQEEPEQEEPKQEELEQEEPQQEESKQEEEQVEEVEVEVEEQEETPESESSSETSGETMTMEATAYTADCEGCTGVTATGIDLKNDRNKKVIAVDPDVIPLGSTVKVDGYGTAIAGDTGGAIKGNIIDLHMPSTDEALQWGRQEVNVEILD